MFLPFASKGLSSLGVQVGRAFAPSAEGWGFEYPVG